ncbi:methyltransferase domain-containing protein [Candidatus Margulisiibacteriota bacterium]
MNIDIFKNISLKKRNNCLVCGTKHSSPVFKMPKFPLTEIYVEQKVSEKLGFIDQEFHLCTKCGHGQLANVVDPEVLYGSCYKTRTEGTTAVPAVDTFLDFVNDILDKNGIKTVETIFEIGCNDVYTLKKMKKRAKVLYGVDPILKGKESTINDDKIKVIGDFFENVDVKGLGLKMGVVLSSHTLEHIEDPKKVVKNMIDNSSFDTLLFFQFPALEELVHDAHFDHVFHQHLNYFSLQSVLYMLDDIGAELVDFKINPMHWSAMMIAFRKKKKGADLNDKFKDMARTRSVSKDYVEKQYQVFKGCMDITAKRIDALKDRVVYGFGAALMLPILDYYTGKLSSLKFIIDDDPDKKDLYYLNVPVQIKPLSQVKDIKGSVFLVTAINSLKAVRAITKKLIEQEVEKIILPVNLM